VIRDALSHKHPLHAEIDKLWLKSPASEEVLQRSVAIQRAWKAALEQPKRDPDAELPLQP